MRHRGAWARAAGAWASATADVARLSAQTCQARGLVTVNLLFHGDGAGRKHEFHVIGRFYDGGRYPLCNLSGRESVLAKCYGQGCGYYEGNGNSGEHKAGLSAPILSRGQYDFWEPILTGRHLSLLAFGAATRAKFIPGWSSNTIIGRSPMRLSTREVAVPEASGSGGCSRRSGQYSGRRPLPQTQHGGISDPAPPLPFPTTRPFDWTSSLLLRSNPQRLHLPVQVTALQPE